MLFKSLLELPDLRNTSIDLLFTKVDQLDQKLSMQPINNWWPDYSGNPHSADDVIRYFTDKFLSLNQNSKRNISVVAINLTDTESVESYVKTAVSTAGYTSPISL